MWETCASAAPDCRQTPCEKLQSVAKPLHTRSLHSTEACTKLHPYLLACTLIHFIALCFSHTSPRGLAVSMLCLRAIQPVESQITFTVNTKPQPKLHPCCLAVKEQTVHFSSYRQSGASRSPRRRIQRAFKWRLLETQRAFTEHGWGKKTCRLRPGGKRRHVLDHAQSGKRTVMPQPWEPSGNSQKMLLCILR